MEWDLTLSPVPAKPTCASTRRSFRFGTASARLPNLPPPRNLCLRLPFHNRARPLPLSPGSAPKPSARRSCGPPSHLSPSFSPSPTAPPPLPPPFSPPGALRRFQHAVPPHRVVPRHDHCVLPGRGHRRTARRSARGGACLFHFV
ncbi:hypothetical protein B0H14DRAFT_3483995 [Mycena olivaceomarginata]|nr:hypothetical protein B0H14DRAFT_3483995 [Mycena olivaceomarginata]